MATLCGVGSAAHAQPVEAERPAPQAEPPAEPAEGEANEDAGVEPEPSPGEMPTQPVHASEAETVDPPGGGAVSTLDASATTEASPSEGRDSHATQEAPAGSEEEPAEALANDRSGASEPDAKGDVATQHSEIKVQRNGGATGEPDATRGWDDDPNLLVRDGLLSIPRVILYVPNVVLRLAFIPIQAALTLTDRYALDEWVKAGLYWNEAETLGWYPTVSYSTSVGPSGGVAVYHKDLLGYDEELKAEASFGGLVTQRYELSFEADRFKGSRLWLDSRVRWETSSDRRFSGIGITGDASCEPGQNVRDSSCETLYSQERVLLVQRLGYTSGQVGQRIKVGTTAVYNRRELGPSKATGGNRPSVEEVYDVAGVEGFSTDVHTLEWQGNVVLDFQASEGLNSSGFYSEMFAGHTIPIDQYSYVHYGAVVSHTIDLYRTTRLLMLRGQLEGAHESGGEIPMVSLPRLGGPARLRGYSVDRFRDRIAALGTAEYRYPIHENIMGQLFFDFGTVAPKYADLFGRAEDWKLGGGGGLVIGNEDDLLFNVGLAYGDRLHFFLSTDLASVFDKQAEVL